MYDDIERMTEDECRAELMELREAIEMSDPDEECIRTALEDRWEALTFRLKVLEDEKDPHNHAR